MELKGLKGFSAWAVYNKVAFNLIFLRRYTKKSRDFNDKIAALFDLDNVDVIKQHLFDLLDEGVNFNTEISECITFFKACNDVDRKLMLVESLNYSDLTDDEVLRLLVLFCIWMFLCICAELILMSCYLLVCVTSFRLQRRGTRRGSVLRLQLYHFGRVDKFCPFCLFWA